MLSHSSIQLTDIAPSRISAPALRRVSRPPSAHVLHSTSYRTYKSMAVSLPQAPKFTHIHFSTRVVASSPPICTSALTSAIPAPGLPNTRRPLFPAWTRPIHSLPLSIARGVPWRASARTRLNMSLMPTSSTRAHVTRPHRRKFIPTHHLLPYRIYCSHRVHSPHHFSSTTCRPPLLRYSILSADSLVAPPSHRSIAFSPGPLPCVACADNCHFHLSGPGRRANL